jgi:predicted permease
MFLETLAQDARFALRILSRTPAFATTVVLTLGVGLGLNTMLFTLFNAYVLRPAAVHDPYSLYQLAYSTQRVRTRPTFSWDQYQAIRSHSPALTDAIASEEFFARVDNRSLDGLLVSGNYFTMLGVATSIGRPILPDDAATEGTGRVMVLSHQMWKSEFGADPAIVGRKILVNAQPLVVIGVCGADFAGLSMSDTPEDFYVPITMAGLLVPRSDPLAPDRPAVLQLVGRLLPGVSPDRAQAALTAAMRQLTEELPETERAIQAVMGSKATAVPLDPRVIAVFSPLIMAFGLVLVICCANVTNMMLARAIGRQREIGVRLSLGASRSRLVRQLVSENVLLALFAGAVGLAVSYLATRGAQQLLVSTLPASYAKLFRLVPLTVDRRVVLFIVIAAGLATIVSGLAPALQATRVTLVGALRGEFSAKVRSSRLRYALVVSQITVCLLLLVLTGVLVRSSSTYQTTEVGYNLRGLVSPLLLNRPDPSGSLKLFQHLAVQPWVGGLAATIRPPLSGLSRSFAVVPAGGSQSEQASYNLVSPEYFGLLGIPILRGRNFAGAEANTEAAVAVISEATARRFWPHEDALGKTIQIGVSKNKIPGEQPKMGPVVVIGIAKDVVSGMLFNGLDSTMVYLPTSVTAARAPLLLVRGKSDTAAARDALEAAITAVIPDRGVLTVSMEDSFAVQVYPFRAGSLVAFALGAMALGLAVAGMYGVMSYLVGQRTKELGIRMALGATPGSVVRLILRHSGRLAATGLLLGVLFSLGASKLLGHVFFMIHAFDPVAYVGGLAAVAAAAMAAAFIPSRRASRIDPVETLRAE